MIAQALSMGLTFLVMWSGRDRVWTPTFEGSRVERFERAVRYYEERMGLDPATILVSDRGRIVDGRERCAWAWRDPAWKDDVVAIWTHKGCNVHKPELLAFHEQAHRRAGHLEPAFWSLPVEQKEREARELMIAYSAKERR
jgi:hypothetical protein